MLKYLMMTVWYLLVPAYCDSFYQYIYYEFNSEVGVLKRHGFFNLQMSNISGAHHVLICQ